MLSFKKHPKRLNEILETSLEIFIILVNNAEEMILTNITQK